jgi:hypothetical protein
MNPPVPTQRILYDVARRAGLVPSGDNTNMDPDKAYEILGFMDDRLQEAWELYDFVETTFIEQRAFRSDFDSSVCYNQGDIVWDPYSSQYYEALAQTIGGPLTNASVWKLNPNTISPRWIPWWQDGKTPIGTCFGAWNKNPYEDRNKIHVEFQTSNRGLEFTATSCLAFVWLLFRVPYPGIGRSEWSASSAYARGDNVIDGMDTYISSIDNNVGQQPSLSPASWTVFRVPWPMSRYLTQAAFADTLIVEGQNEKAPAELDKAYGYLQMAYDRQELQQGQRHNWGGYSGTQPPTSSGGW